MTGLQKDAMAYTIARQFFEELKQYRDTLTLQQLRTLKDQALAGDIIGARRGLARLTEARYDANR